MKIAIAGARGNIGKIIVNELVNTDNELVLLVKENEAANHDSDELMVNNIFVKQTNILNTEEVVAATVGCDVLFWMVPPIVNLQSLKEVYDSVTLAGVTAAKVNQINRVVLISSLGAESGKGLGTISYVGETEKAFKKVVKNLVALRPGYFMENFLLQKESIINEGFFSFPFDEGHKIPFVSSDDIGLEAAKFLADSSWNGFVIKNLMGPKSLDCKEIENIFTTTLNKPVSYRKESYDTIKKTYAQFGLNDTVQGEFYDLLKAVGDKNGVYSLERKLSDSTTTTLESFIKKKFL